MCAWADGLVGFQEEDKNLLVERQEGKAEDGGIKDAR